MDGYGQVRIGGQKYLNSWVPEGTVVPLEICGKCGDKGRDRTTGAPCDCPGTRKMRGEGVDSQRS